MIDFAWDRGTAHTQFGCGSVVKSDKNLDFAAIKLRPLIGGLSLANLPKPERISLNHATSQLYLIHHALSLSKLLSRNCNGSVPVPDAPSEFYHDCDTLPGSSGAPVFDQSGEVVGLHHLGFPDDPSCKRLNRAVWFDAVLKFACADQRSELAAICSSK